jgi:hypothetical protein
MVLENYEVPRGPVMGYHMAPWHWLFVQNIMESARIEPWTSQPAKSLQSPTNQRAILCFLLYIRFNIYLNLSYVVVGRGPGWGGWARSGLWLSPNPQSYVDSIRPSMRTQFKRESKPAILCIGSYDHRLIHRVLARTFQQ